MDSRPTETLANGYCQTCQKKVPDNELIGIEYDFTSRNHYDGVSEWMHGPCGRREGRWSLRVLTDGEEELRYGGAR